MFLDLHPRLRYLLSLSVLHSIGVEALLAPFLDALDPLHRHDRLSHEVAVILDWSVAPLLEFKGGVDRKFLSPRPSVRLRPCDLAWIPLLVEIAMTLRPTESERLRVVANEDDAVPGVAGRRAEIALLDPHGTALLFPRLRCSSSGLGLCKQTGFPPKLSTAALFGGGAGACQS